MLFSLASSRRPPDIKLQVPSNNGCYDCFLSSLRKKLEKTTGQFDFVFGKCIRRKYYKYYKLVLPRCEKHTQTKQSKSEVVRYIRLVIQLVMFKTSVWDIDVRRKAKVKGR